MKPRMSFDNSNSYSMKESSTSLDKRTENGSELKEFIPFLQERDRIGRILKIDRFNKSIFKNILNSNGNRSPDSVYLYSSLPQKKMRQKMLHSSFDERSHFNQTLDPSYSSKKSLELQQQYRDLVAIIKESKNNLVKLASLPPNNKANDKRS